MPGRESPDEHTLGRTFSRVDRPGSYSSFAVVFTALRNILSLDFI